MRYEPRKILEEFNKLMVDIKNTVPEEYAAFISEKQKITASGNLPEKTKWLLLLVASLTQKCPVCIPRAVQHCLEADWTKKEMLEACMIAVLVGGSSVMTYVTLVDKAIEEFK
ncbi:MAG: carboxymuconolactone decarboxylase family protein [Candidatus Omnitrophica bacterium]|nr:carboxymuconolactone decarboxylase family protein [Candidatus Omnitrophota bacterium]